MSEKSEQKASRFCPATKRDIQLLNQKIEKLMSQITDWADQEEADLTAISGTLNAIVTGVKALNDLIAQLKGGGLSPADAAKLAEVKAQSAALVTQAAAISTAPA